MSIEVKEDKVMISGKVAIGATVTYTDKNTVSPAIVLIMGTGKTDRDGNQKGFHTDLYKEFAKFFAENGFVCIRYDKRGTYQTEGNYNTAGLSDLTLDAISVVRYAKEQPFVDDKRVLVCGHSEGIMIASLLTKQENVAGLLLLGGAGMCLKDALFYQNRKSIEEFKVKKGLLGILLRMQASQEKADASVEALFSKCTAAKKERIFFNGAMMNTKWVREHGSYTSKDYVDMLAEFKGAVLAITGTEDLSADYKYLDAFKNMQHIQTYAPKGVNHILRQIDDDNSCLTVQKQYKRLAAQPIHGETRQRIMEWLEEF